MVQSGVTAERTQALVMSMADDYIAALSEAIQLLLENQAVSPKGRWLAQSFLRNGVGASADIGASPNPPVAVLDLLVLASLQSWAFEAHWISAGIGDPGLPVLARLKQAESDIWTTAGSVLTQDQLATVRTLIDGWIAEHPDRSVVAFVRFDEFADSREITSRSLRGQASGLLREVSEATGAIDDARLFGERLMWYAGRYPYVLGEQTELTAYRLLDQPEGEDLFEAVESLQKLSESLTARLATLPEDLDAQQEQLFARISAEREATIAQAQKALDATVDRSLQRASERIDAESNAAIDHMFDRLAGERKALFDDLENRKETLRSIMVELRDTISVSGDLAHELTGTVDAIDRVVSHFDADPKSTSEPLRIADIRDAAIETTHAAEQLTHLLEVTNELIASKSFDDRVASLTNPAQDIVNMAFWRGAILIGMLIAGLALVRMVPRAGERAKPSA